MIEAVEVRAAFAAACDRFDKRVGKTVRYHVAHEAALERFERICREYPESVRDPAFKTEGIDFAYFLLLTYHEAHARLPKIKRRH